MRLKVLDEGEKSSKKNPEQLKAVPDFLFQFKNSTL